MDGNPSACRRAGENLIHPDGEAVARDHDASKYGCHEHGKEQKAAQFLSFGEPPFFHVPPPFCVFRAPSETHDSLIASTERSSLCQRTVPAASSPGHEIAVAPGRPIARRRYLRTYDRPRLGASDQASSPTTVERCA